jgi:Smg-4/UPF3 family
VSRPLIEYAPYQKYIKSKGQPDSKQDTIESSPEYKEFLESLNKPASDPSATTTEEQTHPTTTPLIEFLRQEKAGKAEREKVAREKERARKVATAQAKANAQAVKIRADRLAKVVAASKEAGGAAKPSKAVHPLNDATTSAKPEDPPKSASSRGGRGGGGGGGGKGGRGKQKVNFPQAQAQQPPRTLLQRDQDPAKKKLGGALVVDAPKPSDTTTKPAAPGLPSPSTSTDQSAKPGGPPNRGGRGRGGRGRPHGIYRGGGRGGRGRGAASAPNNEARPTATTGDG